MLGAEKEVAKPIHDYAHGYNIASILSCGSYKICEHTVRRRVQAGIFFGDGKAWEDVGFEIDVGTGAGDFAHGRGREHLLRSYARRECVPFSLRAADEFEWPAIALRVADGLHGQVSDAVAVDILDLYGYVHQDRDERGGFDGGVPAVDVVGGVGFGYAEGLRFRESLVEAEAVFHLAQDYVRRGVEDSVEALQVNRGYLSEQRKDGDAVHDRGFEKEFVPARCCQIAKFAVGVDDGTLVGSDGVGSVLEGGADVINGGLAVVHVEGCGFEEDVGLGGFQPGGDVRKIFHHRGHGGHRGDTWTIAVWQVQSIGVGDPSQAAGGDASDAVRDAVAVAEVLRAVGEQADEGAVDVSEAEEA